MKALRTTLFCCACAAIFLIAAVLSCVLRAKYRSVPEIKTKYAYMYALNLQRYSLLQSNQADPDQGRQALEQYVKLLRRIRDEKISYSPTTLHRDLAIAYLRLYYLEASAGKSAAADTEMKAAQKEWPGAGWNDPDSSTEHLVREINTIEGMEQKTFTNPVSSVATAAAEHDGNTE